jgi:hypothetical protein
MNRQTKLIYTAVIVVIVLGCILAWAITHSPWVGVLVGGALIVEAFLLGRRRRS